MEMMKLLERFTRLLECTSEKAWQKSLFRLGKDYGFEHTLFGVSPRVPTSLEGAFIRGNFSAQWLEVYNAKHFIHIDPRIPHCARHTTPLMWEPSAFASEKQKAMYEEAANHGLRYGITLPIHGVNGEFGMLFFATNTQPKLSVQQDTLKVLPELSLLRDFALESSGKFAAFNSQETAPSLTSGELACLKWCAAGKSTWEISQILGCSEAAVNFHFGNLRLKFKTNSRRHVVVKAMQLGLLNDI